MPASKAEGRAGRRPARRGAPATAREEAWQRFHAVIDSIPAGRVATYGQVAREAGLPKHARHVGASLRGLPPKSALPWHRVVNACGAISERACPGFLRQRKLLEREGVVFGSNGRVDLKRFRWDPEATEDEDA